MAKKSRNKKEYTKENYLENGARTQNQISANQFVNTIQEPALNESGKEAKKKGF